MARFRGKRQAWRNREEIIGNHLSSSKAKFVIISVGLWFRKTFNHGCFLKCIHGMLNQGFHLCREAEILQLQRKGEATKGINIIWSLCMQKFLNLFYKPCDFPALKYFIHLWGGQPFNHQTEQGGTCWYLLSGCFLSPSSQAISAHCSPSPPILCKATTHCEAGMPKPVMPL